MILGAAIYVGIAFFSAMLGFFSTDEAAKYVAPDVLFWCRASCAAIVAGLLQLKGYLSDTYARWVQAKNGNGKESNAASPPVAGG